MSKFSLDASKKPDIPGYEIMCRSFETQGYFYPSMLMHYYLSSYYSLVDDRKKEHQHLERVVAICVEHGSILALVQFLYFSPIAVAEILRSYEPALTERVDLLLEQFITARTKYLKYKNRASVPPSMDEEDIELSIFCAKKYSVGEMAQRFGLSRSGMNRRLSKLYEKWGVSSKEEVSDAYVKSLIDWEQS